MQNRNLKKEGLFKDNLEIKYWYFYYLNSCKEKESRFKDVIKEDWWLFYDKKAILHHRCQLQNKQKIGIFGIQEVRLIKTSKYKKEVNGEIFHLLKKRIP